MFLCWVQFFFSFLCIIVRTDHGGHDFKGQVSFYTDGRINYSSSGHSKIYQSTFIPTVRSGAEGK